MSAYVGLVRTFIAAGQIDQAQQLVDNAPEAIAKDLGYPLNKVTGNVSISEHIVPLDYVSDKVGLPTLNDIIKGKTKLIDITKIITDNNVIYSSNIIGWGLINNIGNQAQKYRWLGSARYTIITILEVLRYKPKEATLIMRQRIQSDVHCNLFRI